MGGDQSKGFAGFRIVHLWKGSPAHLSGLELFFDNILEVDGLSFVYPRQVNPLEFSRQIERSKNRTVKVVVYNSRTNAFRDVWVTPRRWNDRDTGLLGATVRFVEDIFNVSSCGLRVLQVFNDSPAKSAGLNPLDDFLMGTSEVDFKSVENLFDVVTSPDCVSNQIFEVIVYNAKQENVRKVSILADSNWGGEGCLGLDIGEGLLHRLPQPRITHPNSVPTYTYPKESATAEEEEKSSLEKATGCDEKILMDESITSGQPGKSVISDEKLPEPVQRVQSDEGNSDATSSRVTGTNDIRTLFTSPGVSEDSCPRPGIIFVTR